MTVALNKAITIWLVAAFCPSAVARGQQAQSGDARVKSHATTLPAHSPLAPDRLFALASPAVVKLTIKDEDDREIGIASGIIVRFEKENYDIQGKRPYRSTLITNYHVIRAAVSIDVSFSDGQRGWVSAVLAEDKAADLAVLSASSFVEPKRALKLQESADPPIGTKVYAIGSPQGLSNTLSEGLISGYRQRGKHEPWIQITAPISPGSSGGPLLSAEGSVLGVTTAFLSESQNLNFAVPASEISRLLNQTDKPRAVWERASIRDTKDRAFRGAEFHIHLQFSDRANAKAIPDGQYEQTLERFREERLSAGDQLAMLVKGRELYSSKQYAEAIGMLKRATKAEPGEYAYLTHYALAEAIRGNLMVGGGRITKFEAVVEPLIRAKELNPNFGPTFYLLAWTYDVLSKHPEALLEADSLVRLMPRCYAGYQFRGEAWAKLGREVAFERDFETACDLRPNDPDLLIKKAGCYVWLDKLQHAVDTYKDAIKLDEDDALPHYNLGNALQRMGKYGEAIKAYQRALKAAAGGSSWQSDIEGRIAECRRQIIQPP